MNAPLDKLKEITAANVAAGGAIYEQTAPITIAYPVDLNAIKKGMTQFVGFGGVTMTTFKSSYGIVPVEDVVEGRATPIAVWATSDGRGYSEAWHNEAVDGPFADDTVYVEKYEADGRSFHGYVDPVSRKIVQTG